jgi:hypothetical protein
MSKLKPLTTTLSVQSLKFKPGGFPVSFEVEVVNTSSEFATFQLEVIASGVETQVNTGWYRLAPEVSAKIPGGDRTRFLVTITEVPPVPGGFSGTMTLTVRVFSLDLREEDRQVINLTVEGTGVFSPKVELDEEDFHKFPGESIEIPVSVYNPNRHSANVTLTVSGLDRTWLVDGGEQRLQVPPLGKMTTMLFCQLPEPSQVPSQTYPFWIEATQPQTPPVRAQALLTILPMGQVEFRSHPDQQQIPADRRWWRRQSYTPPTFSLEFENQSNLQQQINLQVQYRDIPVHAVVQAGGDRLKAQQNYGQETIELTAKTVPLEVGATQTIPLIVRQKRPWLGWVRRCRLEVKAALADSRIELSQETQILQLKILPLIPTWAQIGLLLFGLILPMLLNRLGVWQTGHLKAVNTVQFNGLGTEVLSASNDQTIRRWHIKGDRLKPTGIVAVVDKAVRVIQYRPVGNTLVAAGLENGEIQVWDLLSKTSQGKFFQQKDDRVFDVEFTRDSRSLFSAHGSGALLQWDLTPGNQNSILPQRQKQLGFAIYSIALVGPEAEHLAIAGRYNRLELWHVKTDRLYSLPYKLGSPKDYIQSITTAAQNPYLLATGDNQGHITLWNLRQCLATESEDCDQIDQSTDFHSAPIKAVALSPDACYLASTDEDGQVVLWSLDNQTGQILKHQFIAQLATAGNAIDLLTRDRQVFIATGDNNSRVNLYTRPLDNPGCR